MTAQCRHISSPSPVSRNHAFRSTRYFSLASEQKFDLSERNTAPGHRQMATYASSAPATDSPHWELDEFPTVAEIAEKVKMNPLAPLYDPTLLGSVTTTSSSTSRDDAKAPAAHIIPGHANNVVPGSDHDSYGPTKIHPDYQQGRDLTQLPTRSSTATSTHQAAIMSHMLQRRDLPPYRSHSVGQSNLELTHYAARKQQQQQTVSGDGYGYTLPEHALHQYTEYASAPTFHPHAMHPPPFLFQGQPQQPFAPLPPSYPYPQIDPHQLDLSPFVPQRRDRPYDNTALATHYLSLFINLYGTSPTCLDSLQKICITLGYADHASQAKHLNNLHASRSNTPIRNHSSHEKPRSHSGCHNRRIHRPGNNSPNVYSANRNYRTPSATLDQTQNNNPHHPPLPPPAVDLPKTIRQTQNYIKSRYVNIFDLVDAGLRGEVIVPELVFISAAELRVYSERTSKICPSEVGRGFGNFGEEKGNELWRWMLRKWY